MSRLTRWITWLCGILIVGSLAVILFGYPRHNAGFTRFEYAGRCDEGAANAPLNSAGIRAVLDMPVALPAECWRHTALPENNVARDFKVNLMQPGLRRIWYRVEYRLPNDWVNRQPLKIYIPRIHAHAWQVWVNDERIADNRAEWRETWHIPVDVTYYPQTHAVGKNLDIRIAIAATDAEGYSISRISVGEGEALRAESTLRDYLQVLVPQATSMVMLMLGVFFLTFWLTRPEEKMYLAMVWVGLAFFVLNLRFSLRRPDDPMLDSLYVFVVHHVAIPWMAWTVYLFVELFAGFSHWYKQLLWWNAVIVTAFFLPVWQHEIDFTLLNIVIYTIVCITIVINLNWLAFRSRKMDFKVIALLICFGGYTPCHDLMMALDWINPEYFYLAPYGTLFVFVGFLYAVQIRFSAAITGQERLNIDLAQRLVEREELTQKLIASENELRSQQQRLLMLERNQALAEERQRLMHDMHDGFGSSLFSTLAAIESEALSQQSVAEALRLCIDDLRLVIDSLDPESNDLPALLSSIRYRLSDRFGAANLELAWEIDDIPSLPWLEPSDALNVLRWVQEALINALKHAKASQVKVSAHTQNDKIAIAVSDNGCGFIYRTDQIGRGLKNQHKRAERLGAEIELSSRIGRGTSITLLLPITKNE